MTDDRGYYRLYGLPPGSYVVAAGGPGQYFGSVNPFANDAPTYAPASTRDTAAEVMVRSDQEVTADIRYRGEPGHMHHKFALIDDTRLLCGSYNWTRGAADVNFENLIDTTHPELVAAFAAEFARLWGRF